MTTTSPATMRNGVDTATLFATLDAVEQQPELAHFQFRAENRWLAGTHSRTTVGGFYGAGGEDTTRTEPFVYEADHPQVLVGTGNGPTPVEFLLVGLASCLTAGLGNIAAARGINLTSVESRIEGDIDLLGVLGLSDEVRNGYEQVRITFKIEGDASDEELRGLLDRSKARSAVFDVLTNGIPVTVDMETS